MSFAETRPISKTLDHSRNRLGISVVWLCLGLSVLVVAGCSRVPQVLTDEAVFGELDALYTAVTSKRRDLLTDCQQRIKKLHDEKRLSDAGHEEIQAIVALTEQDKWRPAAERLYDFMRGQRKAK